MEQQNHQEFDTIVRNKHNKNVQNTGLSHYTGLRSEAVINVNKVNTGKRDTEWVWANLCFVCTQPGHIYTELLKEKKQIVGCSAECCTKRHNQAAHKNYVECEKKRDENKGKGGKKSKKAATTNAVKTTDSAPAPITVTPQTPDYNKMLE